MRLPAVEHEHLARPPLKTMLGQVRFPPILRILDRTVFASFQDEVRSAYPDLAEETQFGVFLGPSGAAQSAPSRQWRLTSSDQAWALLVAPDALTLEASIPGNYTYDEFRERFGTAWSALLSHFQPNRVVQQGLRYVNHLDSSVAERNWRDLINPQLLGAIGSPEFGDDLEQAICDFRFSRPDGTLVLKHGLIPAGPERVPGYLLDFDYFSQLPRTDPATEVLLIHFDEFHAMIYSLFRWCITDVALDEFKISEVGAS